MYIDDCCLSNKITKFYFNKNCCTSLLKDKESTQLAIRVLQCLLGYFPLPNPKFQERKAFLSIQIGLTNFVCQFLSVFGWNLLARLNQQVPKLQEETSIFNHGTSVGVLLFHPRPTLVTTVINLLGSRFLLFTMCSHQILKGVLIKFPMCFSRCFQQHHTLVELS